MLLLGLRVALERVMFHINVMNTTTDYVYHKFNYPKTLVIDLFGFQLGLVVSIQTT